MQIDVVMNVVGGVGISNVMVDVIQVTSTLKDVVEYIDQVAPS